MKIEMICPNCGHEFQDWVKVCIDCGAVLVEKLHNKGLNQDKLWICFPNSALQTSRPDSSQQGQILFLRGHNYLLGGRTIHLLKIPAVDASAKLQYVEVMDFELSLNFEDLIKKMELSTFDELYSDIRWPIVVVWGVYRCSIVYVTSAIKGDRVNIVQLQSDVERCLQSHLIQLDDCDQKPNWHDAFITPMLEHVEVALRQSNINLR
jgi:hypothetical protein